MTPSVAKAPVSRASQGRLFAVQCCKRHSLSALVISHNNFLSPYHSFFTPSFLQASIATSLSRTACSLPFKVRGRNYNSIPPSSVSCCQLRLLLPARESVPHNPPPCSACVIQSISQSVDSPPVSPCPVLLTHLSHPFQSL